MDMRYSSRVRPGPAGRHTCSWCRWFWQCAALTPRMILPGCAKPAPARKAQGAAIMSSQRAHVQSVQGSAILSR